VSYLTEGVGYGRFHKVRYLRRHWLYYNRVTHFFSIPDTQKIALHIRVYHTSGLINLGVHRSFGNRANFEKQPSCAVLLSHQLQKPGSQGGNVGTRCSSSVPLDQGFQHSGSGYLTSITFRGKPTYAAGVVGCHHGVEPVLKRIKLYEQGKINLNGQGYIWLVNLTRTRVPVDNCSSSPLTRPCTSMDNHVTNIDALESFPHKDCRDIVT